MRAAEFTNRKPKQRKTNGVPNNKLSTLSLAKETPKPMTANELARQGERVDEGPAWDKAKKAMVGTTAGIIGAGALIGGVGAYNDSNRAEREMAQQRQQQHSQSKDEVQRIEKIQAELRADAEKSEKRNHVGWTNRTVTDKMTDETYTIKVLNNGKQEIQIYKRDDGRINAALYYPNIMKITRCSIDGMMIPCGSQRISNNYKIMFILGVGDSTGNDIAQKMLSAKTVIKIEVEYLGGDRGIVIFKP